MIARLSALVIWALVAVTAVFWGLRLWARPPAAPTNAVVVGDALAMRGDLTRLFGAPPAAPQAITPEAASRFQLLGVIAPKASTRVGSARYGVALIAVDGQTAKAYAVGSKLDDDLVLRSVGLRTASLGPATGDTALTLELPILPSPSTGTLPAATAPAPQGMAGRLPGRMSGLPGGMPGAAAQAMRPPQSQEPTPVDPNAGGATD